MILFFGVQNILFPINDFLFLFHRKKIITPILTVPSLSHLTSCTPTKSNLYVANSLAVSVWEPALYRLLKFHLPNLMSLFRCLGCTKVSVQVRGLLFDCFATWYFLRWGVVSTSPNPQAEGPPLLIQYIRSYPPHWRPFLHSQPEDVPCRGDRDPPITVL